MTTRVLQVAVVVAGLLVVACGALAAGRQPAGLGLVLAVVAIALVWSASVRPDSSVGLAAIAALGVFWVVEVPDVTSAWTLPAAVALLVLHAGLSLVAMTPPGVALPRQVYVRWSRRGGLVAVLTAAVWALTRGLDAADPAPSLVLTVAAFAAVAVAVLVVSRGSGAEAG